MTGFEVWEDPATVENLSQDIETGLTKREIPETPEDLARQYGCEVDDLEIFLDRRVSKVVHFCEEHPNSYDNELWPGIEVIYRFYLVNKTSRGFASYLESDTEFWKKYAPDASRTLKANLKKRIHFFRDRMVHPKRIFEVEGEKSKWWNCPVYNWKGNWIRYNSLEDKYSGDYVEIEVLEEMENILNAAENWKSDYYHTTNSLALPLIGQDGKVVSARNLEEKGVRPVSGEYCDKLDEEGMPVLPGRKGLNAVYVDKYLPCIFGYSPVSWFDIYQVGFGVNLVRLNRYYQDNGMDPANEREPYPGDGVNIGGEIPLSCMDVIYCEYVEKARVEDWAKKHAPHCRVISVEAFKLLEASYSGETVNDKKDWLKKVRSRKVVSLN